jgi:membrane protein implicated in regulation of membrane protease activity
MDYEQLLSLFRVVGLVCSLVGLVTTGFYVAIVTMIWRLVRKATKDKQEAERLYGLVAQMLERIESGRLAQ